MGSDVVVLSPFKGDENLHPQVMDHLLRGKPGRELVVVLEPEAVDSFRAALRSAVRKRLAEAGTEERESLEKACRECDQVFVGDLDALAGLMAGPVGAFGRTASPSPAEADRALKGHPLSRAARARRYKEGGVDEAALGDIYCRLVLLDESVPRPSRCDPFARFCLLKILDELSRAELLLRLLDASPSESEALAGRIIAVSDLEGEHREKAAALLRRLVDSVRDDPRGPFPLRRLLPLRYLHHDLVFCLDDLAVRLDRFSEDGEDRSLREEDEGPSALKREKPDG